MMKNGETVDYPMDKVERVDFYEKEEIPAEGTYLCSFNDSYYLSYTNGEFDYAVCSWVDQQEGKSYKELYEFNHDKTEYARKWYEDGQIECIDKWVNIKYNADGFITNYDIIWEVGTEDEETCNISVKYTADQRISEFTAIGEDGEVQRHYKFFWSKGLLMKVNSYDEWGELEGITEEYSEYSYEIPNPHETYTWAFNPVSDCLSDWGLGSEFLTLLGKFGKGPKYLLSSIGSYPEYDVTYKIDESGNIREEKLTHNSYMHGSLENIYTYNYTSNPNYKSGK